MARQTDIANRLRAAGLRVVEVAGWQTRGSETFAPRGSVCHHTAGSPNGRIPSLNGVIHGFPGSAPGPLAHALQSREADGRDIFYIVAAGRANHAGLGGWRGLTGNSSVFGLEIEHDGVTPLPLHRQRLAAQFHAALARGRWSAGMICQHKEWAPDRKIDAATRVDPTIFRTMATNYLVAPPGDDDLTPEQAKNLEEIEIVVRRVDATAKAARTEQAAFEMRAKEQLDTIQAQVAALAAKLS